MGWACSFACVHRWVGWDEDGGPLFDPPAPPTGRPLVLAVGGASWPRLGSDGGWAGLFDPAMLTPFRPANCGFTAGWSEIMRRHAGTPLKRIVLRFGGRVAPGEPMLTAGGVEGGPFYALGTLLRDAVLRDGVAVAELDLRPDLSLEELRRRLAAPRRAQSLSTFVRKAAGLPPVSVALLRECAGAPALLGEDIAQAIKALPLRLTGLAGLERAISTAGGLRLEAELPEGLFSAGEMLDWEAPTGGYLLQAAFSTGFGAGEAALRWVRGGSERRIDALDQTLLK